MPPPTSSVQAFNVPALHSAASRKHGTAARQTAPPPQNTPGKHRLIRQLVTGERLSCVCGTRREGLVGFQTVVGPKNTCLLPKMTGRELVDSQLGNAHCFHISGRGRWINSERGVSEARPKPAATSRTEAVLIHSSLPPPQLACSVSFTACELSRAQVH